jgi:hypothetical protein
MGTAKDTRQSSFDDLCLRSRGGSDLFNEDGVGALVSDRCVNVLIGRKINKEVSVERLHAPTPGAESEDSCAEAASSSSHLELSFSGGLDGTPVGGSFSDEGGEQEATIVVGFDEPYKIHESSVAWLQLCGFGQGKFAARTMRTFLGPASKREILASAVASARRSESWTDEDNSIVLYDVHGEPLRLRIDGRAVFRKYCGLVGEIMCAQLRLRRAEAPSFADGLAAAGPRRVSSPAFSRIHLLLHRTINESKLGQPEATR